MKPGCKFPVPGGEALPSQMRYLNHGKEKITLWMRMYSLISKRRTIFRFGFGIFTRSFGDNISDAKSGLLQIFMHVYHHIILIYREFKHTFVLSCVLVCVVDNVNFPHSLIRRQGSRNMLVHKKSCFLLCFLNLRNTNVWAQSEGKIEEKTLKSVFHILSQSLQERLNRLIETAERNNFSPECGSGPLKPEVVWETKNSAGFAAEKVFVNDTSYWLAERGKTADQGFTIKVDSCARWIYGCKLKNLDGGHTWQTKGFRVLGSLSENGPFDTLVEGELKDTRHGTWPAVEFSFENPVQLQFIKFELISYWRNGGALYYFAPVPGRGKNYHSFSREGRN